jgi:acyl-CoA synthetase (NDP forming)
MFPESAARALAAMYRYKLIQSRPEGKIRRFDVMADEAEHIVTSAWEQGRKWLTSQEVGDLLTAYGFEMARSALCQSEEAATTAAREIGYPVVVKLASPDIVHKSDVGGVQADIRNDAEMKTAVARISATAARLKSENPSFRMEGLLVQEMVKDGKETILGMTTDPSFGPVVMFGLGGVYVEVLKDVSFRVAPLTDADAAEMIHSIKGLPILNGARGEKPVDLEKLSECLQRMSQMILDLPEIKEMDINPLIVFEKGRPFKVVDARVALH